MSKVTKNERISTLEKQLSVMQTQISSLIECAHSHTERLIALEPDNPFHGKFYKPERDIAKELLEVDLSGELTGSELCRAMLARGDKYVLCGVSGNDDSDAADHESDDFLAEAVTDFDCKDELFGTTSMRWNYAVPINNKGEPLTASEVGL